MDGIHAHLNTYLLTYQPQLAALVLAYSDVTLLSHTASIFYDRPYLNFPIQLTLLTLSLPAGAAQYGRVSKVGADYITLLVYGVFHCVIQRADIPAWYEFGTMQKDGRRTELMADTRRGALDGWQPKIKSSLATSAAAAAAGDGGDEQLSKKQAAKQKKQLEKEQRRQAYLLTQQQSTADTTAIEPSDGTDGVQDALDYAIRVGSLVRFVILSSVNHDSFVSMSGSLTAEGATVVPGDAVVPAELRAREEAEEEERRKAEEAAATSVESLFAAAEDDTAEADDTAAAVSADGAVHVSKKELKERKRQEKAERKAAKALRKTHKQPHTPAIIPTTTAAANAATARLGVTVREKAEAMRRREVEDEQYELDRRRDDDNQVNSVSVDEGYSHVDQHVIGGEAGVDGVAGEEVKRRKRVREEVNGVRVEVRREKKKRRDKSG